jgi:hypothetical protein
MTDGARLVIAAIDDECNDAYQDEENHSIHSTQLPGVIWYLLPAGLILDCLRSCSICVNDDV